MKETLSSAAQIQFDTLPTKKQRLAMEAYQIGVITIRNLADEKVIDQFEDDLEVAAHETGHQIVAEEEGYQTSASIIPEGSSRGHMRMIGRVFNFGRNFLDDLRGQVKIAFAGGVGAEFMGFTPRGLSSDIGHARFYARVVSMLSNTSKEGIEMDGSIAARGSIFRIGMSGFRARVHRLVKQKQV